MDFEKICVQTGHDGIKKDQDFYVSELFDEYWTNPEKRLAATDFDGTLTRDDVGVLIFKETLSKPDFWSFPNRVFRDLLAPVNPSPGNFLSYRELVLRTTMGNIKTSPDVKKNASQLHALFASLETIYAALQKNPDDLLLREKFSREMIEFDEIVLLLEPFFSNFFGNQIFSRTRFLSGKSNIDTKGLSLETLSAGKIQINDSIFSIFKELKNRGTISRIVTTNLFSIVREIVSASVLKVIFSESDVIATKLRENNTNPTPPFKKQIELSQYIDGEPVFGKRKVELLKQISVREDRRFSFAAGDSVSNDGPMIAESIKNKGVAIIVVPSEEGDIEKVSKTFETRVRNILQKNSLTDDEKQRMWYLRSSQFSDARYL